MEFDPKALGQRLKGARVAKRLSQTDVCNRLPELEISKANVSNWERGRHAPPYEILTKLAALYGMSLNWLILGEEFGEAGMSEEHYEIARRTYDLPEKLQAFVKLALHFAEQGAISLPSSVASDPTEDNWLEYASTLYLLSRRR